MRAAMAKIESRAMVTGKARIRDDDMKGEKYKRAK